MPPQVIPFLILGFVVMSFGITISIISIKNVKQHITGSIDGHTIEIITGFGFAKLVVDNGVVDELRSWAMHTAKLQGKAGEKPIIVNIGSGFLKPKIITFIDECKVEELSNC